ncbi:MAG: cupin domain-containing protein [Pirellulales bacterium]|nr:cupin domain-containing protein [Pirellulales bacterium]
MRYVFDTINCPRYQFPTHTNNLVLDRSDAVNSEVFVVVLEPEQAPPLHKHDDTEQVFYILEGEGTLTVGEERSEHRVSSKQIIRIPPSTLHSIKATGKATLRYLAVDCFCASRAADEPTWDKHVRAVCQQQGWNYAQVVEAKHNFRPDHT